MKNSVIAKRMAAIGLLPIPVKSNKSSIVKWSDVTLASVNDDYLKVFDNENATGIAVIAGKRSGNLECIDIDSKYDIDGNLYETIIDAIVDYSAELFSKLVIVSTPSGGYHLIYRTDTVKRNMKLAMRYQTESEVNAIREANQAAGKSVEVKPSQLVLIETRGEGGYFLTWPSDGYKFIKGGFAEISDISPKEHKTLLEICRSFDQVKPKEDPIKVNLEQKKLPNYEPPKNVVTRRKYIKKPWDDYNERGDIIAFLLNEGWSVVRNIPSTDDGRIVTYLKRPGVTDKDVSATFNHVPGRVYCFTSSTALPMNTPLTPFEVYMRIKHDSRVRPAIEAIEEMGYGVRSNASPGDRMADEVDRTSNMSRILSRDPDVVRGVELNIWWDVEITERKNGSIKKEIHIQQSRFVDWLEGKGLRKMQSGGKYDYYMLDGCICDPVTREDISVFVNRFIKELPDRFDFISREELLEAFVRGADTYLSFIKLSMVKNIIEDDFMRDTDKECYLPFSNGILKITGQKLEIVPYAKFNKLLWRSSIKPYDFRAHDDLVLDGHDFCRFLYNISGRSTDRFMNVQQMIGFMLSTYKDPANPSAVILMDQKLTDNSDGGTGKGLLVKAMSYVRSTVYEDGKIANKRNQSEFRFSRVTKDTNIIHLSDVEKGFDFEAMFTLITEGLPLNKKFRDEEFIPYSKSPKIIVSTNYSVGGRGNSHDRRRIEFELPPYYSRSFTPVQEFGRPLFDAWDNNDWVVFYGIMARCIKAYLKNGMPKFVGINIEARKFIGETSPEFVAWFNIIFGAPEFISVSGPKLKGKLLFSQLYSEYLSYSGLERSETRPSRFIRYLQSGCRHVGLDMMEVSEVRSPYGRDLERYIVISDPSEGEKKVRFEEQLRLNS